MPELTIPHLSSYPPTSGIITGILLSQTGHWTPNKPVQIQLRIHYQKEGVTFQKGAQVSPLLILSFWTGAVLTLPWHGIRFEPWVKIKPWWAKWCDFLTILNAAPQLAGCIWAPHAQCCISPHVQTHIQIAELQFTIKPSICTDAQQHKSKDLTATCTSTLLSSEPH